MFWFGNGVIEKILFFGSIFIVLIVELFNSVVELVVDCIGLEYYEFLGCVKDIGFVVVFVVMVFFIIIWGLIFLF